MVATDAVVFVTLSHGRVDRVFLRYVSNWIADGYVLLHLLTFCTLTWLHSVGEHVLWPVHDVQVRLQGSVEGLDLVQGQVQDRVSGGIVEAYLLDSALSINAAQRGGGRTDVTMSYQSLNN